MQMLSTATNLNWSGWLRGLIGSAVSGGAGAVSSGFAATILDPSHDLNVFKLMGFTFLFSAVISLAKFLQTAPVPEPDAPKP